MPRTLRRHRRPRRETARVKYNHHAPAHHVRARALDDARGDDDDGGVNDSGSGFGACLVAWINRRVRASLTSATTRDARGVRSGRVRARSMRARGACALGHAHARVDCVTIGRSFELHDGSDVDAFRLTIASTGTWFARRARVRVNVRELRACDAARLTTMTLACVLFRIRRRRARLHSRAPRGARARMMRYPRCQPCACARIM